MRRLIAGLLVWLTLCGFGGGGGSGGGGSGGSVSANAPLSGNGTSGSPLVCSTCATTTNGGALSGTAPIAVSAGGVISGGGLGSTTGALKGNGSGVISQAACADLSNSAASCSTDATNATNISSGTLATARGGNGSPFYAYPGLKISCQSAATTSTTTNAINVRGFYAPGPWSIQSSLAWFITTIDNSGDVYDFDIYSVSAPGGTATLIANIGTQSFTTTTGLNTKQIVTVGSCTGAGTATVNAVNVTTNTTECTGSGTGSAPTVPLVEPAGYYLYAWTGNASTLHPTTCNGGSDFEWTAQNSVATTNGILPQTFTAPSVSAQTSGGALISTF